MKVVSGACALFDPESGCRLPFDARPVACRLYPFEPWPDGTVSVLAGPSAGAEPDEPRCLAVDEADGVEALAAAFGLDDASLSRLTALLRESVQDHARRTARGLGAP